MEHGFPCRRIVENMRIPNAILLLVLAPVLSASAQQPADAPSGAPVAVQAPQDTTPLPSIPELLLDVERNQQAAEKMQKDYTYHVHMEEQDLDGKGNTKKTTVTDSESLTIDGVRVDRIVAKNGKPLTPEEAKKESEKIDQEVAKDKERREKREVKGQETDSRGEEVLTVSRILELGTFSNPRRIDLDGRPTIVADYAGDPKAKTKSRFESAFRDLVGTVWIDEKDRVLVRGQGHFLNDFKIGGGLVLDIHKGLSFEFATTKINGEVWLPASVEFQGSARFLLFGGVNGRLHLVTSDYRKFRTSSTIIQSDRLIGPDGNPLPDQPNTPAPKPDDVPGKGTPDQPKPQ